MKKIKVLHFIPGYKFGGIETTTRNLFNYLKDKDIVDIEVLVEQQDDMSHIEQLAKDGCKVHVINKVNFKHLRQYNADIMSVISSANYSVVHSYNITRTPFFFLAAKNKGIKKRIYHARTNLSSTNRLKRIIYRVFIILGVMLTTDFFACSEEAGKYFFRRKKFQVIKNGIDTEKFLFNPSTREQIRKSLQVENKFVVGHVGRFSEAKNHTFIIKVFKEILNKNINAVLLLVGDGPTRKQVERMIDEYDISDRIIFTGVSSNVNEFLQAMDVFIFPSLHEGFGNVVIEAQVSGLKVVASDKVPNSVKLSNLVKFLSLEDSVTDWADLIISENNSIRKSRDEEIKKYGYDVQQISKYIMNYYIETK